MEWRALAACVVVACAALGGGARASTAAPGAGGSTPQSQPLLLPRGLAPLHYDLKIAADIDERSNFSYFGIVRISVQCLEESAEVVLHGDKFTVAEDAVAVEELGDGSGAPAGAPARAGLDSHKMTSLHLDHERQFLTLKLDKALTRGKNYTITIPFYGNLKKGLNGVYVSEYTDRKSGATKHLVVTQFEPTYARLNFPCMDEPEYKATFTLTIGHHPNYTAISNMPVRASNPTDEDAGASWNNALSFTTPVSEFVWDEFERSLPMSTYLLAFMISEFISVRQPGAGESTGTGGRVRVGDTDFNIWARNEFATQAEYASVMGPKLLKEFEEYFDVKFPLPKQDMAAIPDFAAGAMENWGLITYRESMLLFDPKEASFNSKQAIAYVISHELSHQWFGNLVTMRWWDNLWLNEGFATYIGAFGVQKVEPSWDYLDSATVKATGVVLTLDALLSSRPIVNKIDDKYKIMEAFDGIAYSKGALVIRMMHDFLGDRAFRQGLTSYLVKNSYGNTISDDLWLELTAAAARPGSGARLPDTNSGSGSVSVKSVMDTWTRQVGYPVLTVARDYGAGTAAVTQHRYVSLASNSTEPRAAGAWWVPLHVQTAGTAGTAGHGDDTSLVWMSDRDGTTQPFTLKHGAGADQWLLLNANMKVLCRVNYDARNWQLVSAALAGPDAARVPVLSRVQLLNDAFQLAFTGHIDYTIPLQLVGYLRSETEHLPLSAGLGALNRIGELLFRSPDYGAFQKFVRKLVGDAFRRAGGLPQRLDAADVNKLEMQVLVSRWALRVRVPGAEDQAVAMFRAWMAANNTGDNPIPVDLREMVYCAALRRGSVREWAFLYEQYARTSLPTSRDTMRAALTCTNEIWLLMQFLEWTVQDGKDIRSQDAVGALGDMVRSPAGYYLAKTFVMRRLPDLAAFIESRRFGKLVDALAGQVYSQHDLDELVSWTEGAAHAHLVGARQAVAQALEKARVRVAWLRAHRAHVLDLLREYAQ